MLTASLITMTLAALGLVVSFEATGYNTGITPDWANRLSYASIVVLILGLLGFLWSLGAWVWSLLS